MSYPRALTRAVLCMLLSLMLLACEEGGKGAPGSSGPREVVIIKLEPRREVYTTALAGRIASFQVAEVRPQVGGILQQRLFTEGADVKAGQALYQIDPATYEAALDSAQAALMKAEANVTPARLKAERFRELLAIKAVSKQEYDDAQAAFKQAEADVAVNRAAVKTRPYQSGIHQSPFPHFRTHRQVGVHARRAGDRQSGAGADLRAPA